MNMEYMYSGFGIMKYCMNKKKFLRGLRLVWIKLCFKLTYSLHKPYCGGVQPHPVMTLKIEDPAPSRKTGTGSLHACPERSRRMERGSGVSFYWSHEGLLQKVSWKRARSEVSVKQFFSFL